MNISAQIEVDCGPEISKGTMEFITSSTHFRSTPIGLTYDVDIIVPGGKKYTTNLFTLRQILTTLEAITNGR